MLEATLQNEVEFPVAVIFRRVKRMDHILSQISRLVESVVFFLPDCATVVHIFPPPTTTLTLCSTWYSSVDCFAHAMLEWKLHRPRWAEFLEDPAAY